MVITVVATVKYENGINSMNLLNDSDQYSNCHVIPICQQIVNWPIWRKIYFVEQIEKHKSDGVKQFIQILFDWMPFKLFRRFSWKEILHV